MKKILKNTAKTERYLKSLPKYYIIACWAKWGIMAYPFSGKYYHRKDGFDVPLVYKYNDHKCTKDQFELTHIDNTTTGLIIAWTQSERFARNLANMLNERDFPDVQMNVL